MRETRSVLAAAARIVTALPVLLASACTVPNPLFGPTSDGTETTSAADDPSTSTTPSDPTEAPDPTSNHKATLRAELEDPSMVPCTYRGGASQANPQSGDDDSSCFVPVYGPGTVHVLQFSDPQALVDALEASEDCDD